MSFSHRDRECNVEMFSSASSAVRIYPFKTQGREVVSLPIYASGSQPRPSIRITGRESEIHSLGSIQTHEVRFPGGGRYSGTRIFFKVPQVSLICSQGWKPLFHGIQDCSAVSSNSVIFQPWGSFKNYSLIHRDSDSVGQRRDPGICVFFFF